MNGMALYRCLTRLAMPMARLLLRRRLAKGKEEGPRIKEREGIASLARPDAPLAWLHAASVGEAQSALVLIERLLRERPDVRMLVTTGTVTSASHLKERLPPRAFHQYLPLDCPLAPGCGVLDGIRAVAQFSCRNHAPRDTRSVGECPHVSRVVSSLAASERRGTSSALWILHVFGSN